MSEARRLGATPLSDGRCRFLVWAPRASAVAVHVVAPDDRMVPLAPDGAGYFHAVVDDVAPGARYLYQLDGRVERPDPASRSQPEGVHGPSEVIDLAFDFQADFRGLRLQDYILYELHVGTFTPAGTFEAAIEELPRLCGLGITAVEIMPVAQFPGDRNWGYDGVLPSAVQASYGGARGLQRLVDACHAVGIAVVLDVVYNHMGPEGNYLAEYGPYFTDVYRTPWGQALNFDGPHSDEVRRYFIESAVEWVEHYRIDGLRLDAIHAIHDTRAMTFLEELTVAVQGRARALGRDAHVMAESGLNDPRLVRPRDQGGLGMDAMWSDDFHHALHALLTGERDGYYVDFGQVADLAACWRDRQTYAGRHSRYRERRHGRPGTDVPAIRYIVCAENHDQIGNRKLGDRLVESCGPEGRKLAAACVLLSPHMPLLFMGEEYGETAPFQFFVSHGDPALVEAVRQGRKEEFAAFGWEGEVPDPQALETFERCRIDSGLRSASPHAELETWYATLIDLRKRLGPDEVEVRVDEDNGCLQVFPRDPGGGGAYWLVMAFARQRRSVRLEPPAKGEWHKCLASADVRWCGPGDDMPATIGSAVEVTLPAQGCVLYLASVSRA